MDSITLQNYRCFREKQTARLAPLTLLVGENSTGKTSFLALIRALWDVAFRDVVPYFREEPYDMGAFRDIVYNGGRSEPANSFEAGFEDHQSRTRIPRMEEASFHVTFAERGGVPFPAKRRIVRQETWFETEIQYNAQNLVRFGTPQGEIEHNVESNLLQGYDVLVPLWYLIADFARRGADDPDREKEYLDPLRNWAMHSLRFESLFRSESDGKQRPFAGAPVRSRPRRTYDPTRPYHDPEGEYIPTYLASMSHRDAGQWQGLKGALEKFGHDSGLFNEISVKSLGETEGTPFQIQVREFGKKLEDSQRNLIDVGYGVSQALPVLTELLRPDAPSLFLLQQPEVHLHPKAQAALGSLFCSIAGEERQLIVETHSDYIIDRVRMDIRDEKSALKSDDVSILFFEPGESDVKIHSLGLDVMGNVLNAPDGYGQFFMDEMRRSIGL